MIKERIAGRKIELQVIGDKVVMDYAGLTTSLTKDELDEMIQILVDSAADLEYESDSSKN